MKYTLEINKKKFDVTISDIAGNKAHVMVNGQPYEVGIGGGPQMPSAPFTSIQPAVPAQATSVHAPVRAKKSQSTPPVGQGQGEPVLAPIPGLILEIKVKVGQAVNAGQIVAVLEAMKMENSLVTHVSGTVKEIRVEKGAQVSTGDVILIIG